MENIKICKMTKENLPRVFEIEKEAFPIPWSLSSFEEELNNMLASFLVAKIDDEIVGYLGMWFVMDECHIGNIAIDKNYRRLGVATKLIEELFKECRYHQTSYIMLEVRTSNIAAQKLYAKLGFKNQVIRKNYYRNPDGTCEDAIIMDMDF